MTEQLISFETAKLAKEKRATNSPDNYLQSEYVYERDRLFHRRDFLSCFSDGIFIAPTQSLLQKWLREKHGHHILIIPTVTAAWTYHTVRVISEVDNDYIVGIKSVDQLPPYVEVTGEDFRTYEEALESALQHALSLIP